jgi:hypothetical protein
MNDKTATARLQEICAGEGLVAPPIPQDLVEGFREQDDWLFGSQDVDRMGMYLFEPAVPILMGKMQPQVAFGYGGHGIASWGLTYILVWGPMALLLQYSFGGFGGDDQETYEARCVETINAAYQLAHDMVSTGARWESDRPGRLVVAVSDYRGYNNWGWMEAPLTEEQALQWRDHDQWQHADQADSLTAARDWLVAFDSAGRTGR